MPAVAIQIRRLLNIHEDETRTTILVVGVMLLTSAGFSLGSTGVEALFFSRFGVEYLPSMYMILGFLSFLTSVGITALLGRVRRETLYVRLPIAIAIITVAAWMTLFSKFSLIYPALWLGKEAINTLVSLVVWGIAGTLCDTRQSKRLFPLFNSGRILGAVVGGLSTGMLVKVIGTPNLLLVWAGTLVCSFFLIRALMAARVPAIPESRTSRIRKPPSFIQDVQRGYRYVRSSALMRWVSLAAVLFSVLYFSIALPFSKSATVHYPDENSLAGFLGLFNGLSTGAAFMASVFIANRLYARTGIMKAILVLPVIYFLGFGAMTLTNSFAIIIIFRFTQILWLSGIADSAYQAMFNAVPETYREQVRAFIGGVPEQAGTFLAGAVLFIGEKTFTSQGLAISGLVSAAGTVFVFWKAGHAYHRTLVDSLRAWRPAIFDGDQRAGEQMDAEAIQIALQGATNADPLIRRVSTRLLARSGQPAVEAALVDRLQDEDAEVRLSALQGLAHPEAAPAVFEIAALLTDALPAVKAQAVDTLRAISLYPRGLLNLITPLLQDPDAVVRIRTAVALVELDRQEPARLLLRQLCLLGNEDERILALEALVEVGDPEAIRLFSTELEDKFAPSAVRRAAALALGKCGPDAIPFLIAAMVTEESGVQSSIAAGLGQIGEVALAPVLNALDKPESESCALMALEKLPAWKNSGRVKEYAQRRVNSALHYEDLRKAVSFSRDDRMCLLEESLRARAGKDGIFALRAISTLGEHKTIKIAIEHLQNGNPAQIPDALEALEALSDARLIRPIFRIWETNQNSKPDLNISEAIVQLMNDDDDWVRECANYANQSKDGHMEIPTTLSIMDRVLLLRRVPLLAALTPEDLQRVAAISSELEFLDGEAISIEGEPGDEMFIIISGNVRVQVERAGQSKKEIAVRTAGEVVGEMSIISGEARMATLVADGVVRLLCIDRLSFESLLRERPEVCMAVMRELVSRIKQMM